MNHRFTILTACCNGSLYINDWMNSVLSQSYRPLSVIVMDDRSTDGSKEIIGSHKRDFSKQNIDLMILNSPKKLYYGGALRHAFLSSINCSFFGILDIDDCLAPDAVEHVMKLYSKYRKIGYIYTQFMICDESLTPQKTGFCINPPKKESILSMGLKNIHVYSHFRTFSCRVVDPSSIFPKRGRYAVDQYMGLTLERRAYGLFTDKVCYYYRSNIKGSISSRFGGQRREYWHKLLNHFKTVKKRVYRIKHHDGQ